MKPITPAIEVATAGSRLFYDGECRLCIDAARRFEPVLRRHHFDLVPLQTPSAMRLLGLKPGEPLAEMKLLTGNGKIFGGADALLQVARGIWWAWPLYAASFLPGVKGSLRRIYRIIAERRNCRSNRCEASARRFFITDWILLYALVLAAWLVAGRGPAWVMCWSLVLAMVWGFKWPIWQRAKRARGVRGAMRRFIAFFGWPGMDADIFFDENPKPSVAAPSVWLAAVLKIVFGAVLLWGMAGRLIDRPLLAGWVGMIGLVFLLHFGFFHLLALIYRKAGIAVEPIMRAPVMATSVGEFWGRRWNLAFNKIAFDFGFIPLKRRLGIAGATLFVFVASGLIHELLISVPARGGYGLPTVYFVVQGLGLVFERTDIARRLGLGCGWRGWLFMAACTAGPAFWLFHPTFIYHVILPMLHAIGAT